MLRSALGRMTTMTSFGGEPSLEDLLSDPLIHRVMRADDVTMLRLCEILVKASAAASAARAVASAAAKSTIAVRSR